MARRKRASMREGPLADLFRSTTGRDEPADEGTGEQPTDLMKSEGAEAPVRGSSVLKYDPKGNAANYYRELAQEVLTNGTS